MRLSERIEQADYDCRSLWTYLEAAKHPANGDAANRLKAVMQTLIDCERLAKRYEDAPVAKAAYYYRPTMGAATGIMFEGPDFTPLAGQRVRIVLDKEG